MCIYAHKVNKFLIHVETFFRLAILDRLFLYDQCKIKSFKYMFWCLNVFKDFIIIKCLPGFISCHQCL